MKSVNKIISDLAGVKLQKTETISVSLKNNGKDTAKKTIKYKKL